MKDSVVRAQANLLRAETGTVIEAVVTDKGYDKAEGMRWYLDLGIRTYLAERKQDGHRRWTNKPDVFKDAVYSNRSRAQTKRGRKRQRLRAEIVERAFAHVSDGGGLRRSWLRGLENVGKRYLIQAAAHSLGVPMRKLVGVGAPRGRRPPFRGLLELS